MKKSYIEPIVAVEAFCLNENIAACTMIVSREQREMYESLRPTNTEISGCSDFCPTQAEDTIDHILDITAFS